MNFVRKLDIRRLANVLGETLQRENGLTTKLYSSLLSQVKLVVFLCIAFLKNDFKAY